MEISSPDQIRKGKQICVTVEEALLDVLLVSYRCGVKVFQGILLDISKKNCAYGIIPPHPNWPRDPSSEKTSEGPSEDKFHAVRQRHTYFQQCTDLFQRPVQANEPVSGASKKAVSKTARSRDQSVRMRRLRPRQVLCYHCQAFCNDGLVKTKNESTNSGSSASKANSSSSTHQKASSPPPAPPPIPPHPPDGNTSAKASKASKTSSQTRQTRQNAVSKATQNKTVSSTTSPINKQNGCPTNPVNNSTATQTSPSLNKIIKGNNNNINNTIGTNNTNAGPSPVTSTSPIPENVNDSTYTKVLSSPLKMAKISLQKLQVNAGTDSKTEPSADDAPNILQAPKNEQSDEYQAVSSSEPSNRLVLRKRLLSASSDNANVSPRKQRKTPPSSKKVDVKSVDEHPPLASIVIPQPSPPLPPPTPPPPPPPSTASPPPLPLNQSHTNVAASVPSLIVINKTSPVIKISFANPQGKESILKIPPRVQSLTSSDNEEDSTWLAAGNADTKATKDASAKAAKKALKKARKDAQRKLVLNLRSPSNTSVNSDYTSPSQTPKSRHHHKHKLKRKKKHKGSPPGDVGPHHFNYLSPNHFISSSQGENSENELTGINGSTPHCFSPNNENRCIRKKLSISLKRLNAKAYTSCSPKYVVRDDEIPFQLPQSTSIGSTSPSGSDCGGDGNDTVPDFPKHEPPTDRLKPPLMMRLGSPNHHHPIKKCLLENGKEMTIGDVVWGKIQGFPWWPGKVLSLAESQRVDNGTSSLIHVAHVAWFGSSTSSYMPCNQLTSFVDEFKVRYNRKKRGPYKEAIRQATLEVEAQNGQAELPIEFSTLTT